MAGAREDRSSVRPRWFVPVIVVVALAVLAAVLVLVTADDDGAIAIIPSTTRATNPGDPTGEAPVAVSIGPDGGEVIGPGGVVVAIPDGALDRTGVVHIRAADDAPTLGEAVEVLGDLVDVSIEGATLTGDVEITFPIPDVPAPSIPGDVDVPGATDAGLVVAHYTGGEWEAIEGAVSADGRSFTVRASTLSPFGLVKIAANFVKDLIKSFVTELTGGLVSFVPTPTCGDGVDDAASWTSTPAAAPYVWCAAITPEGARTVQVVNRRRYAVTVSGRDGVVASSSTDLSTQISGLLNPDGVASLGPGEVATFSFPAAVPTPHVVAEYDGVAQAITSLSVAAEILAAIAGKVPFAKKKSAKEFLRVLKGAMCLKSMGIDVDASARHPASTIAKLVLGCLREVVAGGLGVLGTVLSGTIGVVAGTIAYFVSSGSAVFDLLFGGAGGTLRRDASTTSTAPPVQPPPSTDPPPSQTAWPVHDNEGPPALFALIGAELVGFPDWSSCIPEWCLVGLGTEIRAYAFAPGPQYRGSLQDTATTPEAAVALLIAEGFDEEQARGLTTAGPVG